MRNNISRGWIVPAVHADVENPNVFAYQILLW
jgi:hypothetical protein